MYKTITGTKAGASYATLARHDEHFYNGAYADPNQNGSARRLYRQFVEHASQKELGGISQNAIDRTHTVKTITGQRLVSSVNPRQDPTEFGDNFFLHRFPRSGF